MEEYIQNDEWNERRKKQDYLIKNVIQAGFDPEAFSEFLNQERHDGQNIDNWNLEELETMVGLFKKNYTPKPADVALYYKLEDIELNDDEKSVYVKRIATPKKKRTVLSAQDVYILISNIEVIDGGIFFGKSLCFHIETPQIEARVRRTEAEFRWLHESLSTEFPAVPLPPLLRVSDRYAEPGVLGQYKKFFEKYLNECARHRELRHSMALEVFLLCQSKEELTMRTKEVGKFYKKNVLLDKGFTKKTFDAINSEVLEVFPTAAGALDVKISQVLKKHFAAVDGQFYQYDAIFDRIEKLTLDYNKSFAKLLAVNRRMRESFLELQNVAIKHNSAKEVKLKTNLIEDAVFSSLTSYFDNFGPLSRATNRRAEEHRQQQHRRLLQVHARIPEQCPRHGRPAEFGLQRILPPQNRAERKEEQKAAAR